MPQDRHIGWNRKSRPFTDPRKPPSGFNPHNYQWAITHNRMVPRAGVEQAWKKGTFCFTSDQNFCFFTGEVCKNPSLQGNVKSTPFVWFRIVVKDTTHDGRMLWLPVRTQGQVAEEVYANIHIGDLVGVRGRLFTGEIKRGKQKSKFEYLLADQVTTNLPVYVDQDRRFVRVRADMWNALVGDRTDLPKADLPKPRDMEPAEGPGEWADIVVEDTNEDDRKADPSVEG